MVEQGAGPEVEMVRALEKHLWPRLWKRDTRAGLSPFYAVRDHVLEAWRFKLQRLEEVPFCGTKALYGALRVTKRRYCKSVDEANDYFRAASKVANFLWDTLDREGEAGFRKAWKGMEGTIGKRFREAVIA